MATLYPISAYSQSVLPAEVCQAIEIGENSLMLASIKNASDELFALSKSSCGTKKTATLCLFLYTYALEGWCSTGDNYLSEKKLISILACIEKTSKTCCTNG